MIGSLVVVAGVLLLVAGAVLYARRAGRVTHHRKSTGLEVRGLDSFDVPPPAPADGPVSMHLEMRRPPVDPPVVQQSLDQITREVLAAVTGRHRRPDGDLPPDAVSATSIFRRVRAEDAARPPLPTPTRDQLREVGR